MSTTNQDEAWAPKERRDWVDRYLDGKQIEEFAEWMARQEAASRYHISPPLPVSATFPHILSAAELAYIETLRA